MSGAGAAASLALMKPGALRAQNKTDVLVIGAGLSGLNAALMLESEGVNVQVIEAQNRIGGRVLSLRNIPGTPEAGGTSMGAGYARMVDTARKYGVKLIDVTPQIPFFGQRELVLNGEIITADAWPNHAKNPFPEPLRKVMPWAFIYALAAGKNPLDALEDWVDPKMAAQDISVHQWMSDQGASEAAIQVGYDMNISHGFTAHDVSILMLFFVMAFANLQRQLSPRVAGYTAENGNQSIPEAMAGALNKEVHMGREVVGIRTSADGCEVHCTDGTVYKSDYVICSLPFGVLRNIDLDPILTGLQSKAVKTLPAQLITQTHIVPKRAFWEDDGFAPSMYTDTPAGMILAERKSNDPADVTSLTAWSRGPEAARLDQMPEADARALVIKSIEDIRPAAKGQLEILGYKSWYRDPYSAGDWAYWHPGQVTEQARHVATPHGRIHFCGEHTAVSNRGMEGAMESGERAALEIFAKI